MGSLLLVTSWPGADRRLPRLHPGKFAAGMKLAQRLTTHSGIPTQSRRLKSIRD